jgi:hypothetical protein
MSTCRPGCGWRSRRRGRASLTDDEAVELGLCYGWISGQRKHYSKVYYLQKYVPRRPRSRWSQVNVAKVEELIRAGRMRPSGLAEVEAAKADGRWAAAYQPQRNATVPTRSRRRPGGEPAGGASVRRAQQEPAVCGDPETSYGRHRHRPRRPAPQSHDHARSMQRLVNWTGSWSSTASSRLGLGLVATAGTFPAGLVLLDPKLMRLDAWLEPISKLPTAVDPI